MRWILLLAALLLTGCGTAITRDGQAAGPGQASYEYLRTAPDGTEVRVRITSGRDADTGHVRIGPDGSLEAEASRLSGQEVQMQLFDRLLERVP